MSLDTNIKIIVGMTYTKKELIEIIKPRKIFTTEYVDEIGIKCSKCNRVNMDNSKFCSNCGNSLVSKKEVITQEGETFYDIEESLREYFEENYDLIFDRIESCVGFEENEKEYYLGIILLCKTDDEFGTGSISFNIDEVGIKRLEIIKKLSDNADSKYLNHVPCVHFIMEIY